jgi:hypothetical protein
LLYLSIAGLVGILRKRPNKKWLFLTFHFYGAGFRSTDEYFFALKCKNLIYRTNANIRA